MPIDESILKRIQSNDITLTQLSLRGKSLTDNDIYLLITALRTNTHLKTLDLTNNRITTAAAKSLIENCRLTKLQIYNGNKNIGKSGLGVLFEAIKKNPILREFPIQGGSGGTIEAIRKYLKERSAVPFIIPTFASVAADIAQQNALKQECKVVKVKVEVEPLREHVLYQGDARTIVAAPLIASTSAMLGAAIAGGTTTTRDDRKIVVDEKKAEAAQKAVQRLGGDPSAEKKHEKEAVVRQIISKKTGGIRVKVSNRLEWFSNPDEGREKQLCRMVQTQSRFFDIDRSKNLYTQGLSETFRRSRCGISQCAVDITRYSGRSYITADAGALKKQLQLQGVDKKELTSYADIEAKLGYAVTVPRSNNMCNGVWELVSMGYSTVSYQIKPLPGHLGNRLIKGLSKYGHNGSSDILYNIYQIIGVPGVDDSKETIARHQENERKLARLFLDAASKPFEINPQKLIEYGINSAYKKPAVYNYLNRILVLCNFHEISRRMYPGRRTESRGGGDVEEMPFALTYIEALELVASGHAYMKDVFGSNCKFGLPTVDESSAVYSIRGMEGKVYQLHDEYFQKEVKLSTDEVRTIADLESKYSGRHYVAFFREPLHQKLRQVYGGGYDTDNEGYKSSDEETNSYS
ncbi:MAG: hypothetical protein M1561_00500 [Gammaproteobacteria bacterium]|nr:hypothetical protein [Gammaproteobacteria bacterium]